MSTCPPLARDRLIGLADSSKNLVGTLEEGKLPRIWQQTFWTRISRKITAILSQMLDVDIFPWIEEKRKPSKEERYRSSTIVADRLCGAVAEPIVRNAQEKRQLALIEKYLTDRGYKLKAHPAGHAAQSDGARHVFFPAQCPGEAVQGRSQDREDSHRRGDPT